MDLQKELNPQQYAAVTHGNGPMLVLAGAGSGKTRVITYRIAWLLANSSYLPHEIMAVTFTNKAAREMKERVSHLLGGGRNQVTVGTFHSTCARLLRNYASEVGRTTDFAIYDQKDAEAVLVKVMQRLNVSTELHPTKKVLHAIGNAKIDLLLPADYMKKHVDFYGRTIGPIYEGYQEDLKKSNAFDFGDLLLQFTKLLQRRPDILEQVRQRFRYLLIDEYQDTNFSQLELIRLLAGPDPQLCAVGDDDQSIYQFRGADPKNILEFEKTFPTTKIYKLEHNYRSTKTIVAASNAVAQNNKGRKQKTLFTDNATGEPISVYFAEDERDEAAFIARTAKEYGTMRQMPFRDMAVLYRTNAQSRVLEEQFHNNNVPYVIVGGTGFYERKEIKDIVSYLRLMLDPSNSIALERVINVPKRGIGKTTVDRIVETAHSRNLTLFDALDIVIEDGSVNAGTASKLRNFQSLIINLRERSRRLTIAELVREVIDATGYLLMLDEEGTVEAKDRKSNVIELLNAVNSYQEEHGPEASLAGFLELTALSTTQDAEEVNDDRVCLMTLHSSKGLEFPVVFLSGVEDGLIPHENSRDNRESVEEERRLFYVGITRARKELFLTSAGLRRWMGSERYQAQSPFLKEIPEDYLRVLKGRSMGGARSGVSSGSYSFRGNNPRPGQGGSQGRGGYQSPAGSYRSHEGSASTRLSTPQPPLNQERVPTPGMPSTSTVLRALGQETIKWPKGCRVLHQKLGEGVVVEYDGTDRITVNFVQGGEKKLSLAYAKLERLDG